MPIDTSMYRTAVVPEPESPLNQMAKLYQLRGAQQESQLNQLKLAAAQTASKRDVELRNFLAGNPDMPPAEMQQRLATQFGPEGFALSEKMTNAQAKQVENKTKTYDLAGKALAHVQQFLPLVTDSQDAANYIKLLYGNSEINAALSQVKPLDQALADVTRATATPEGLDMWKRAHAGLTPDKLFPPPPTDLEERRVAASERRAAAAEQRAGMAGAPNKPPMGYRFTSEGNLEAIPGGPGDPAVVSNKATQTLSAKDRVQREAAFPKATSALTTAIQENDSLIKDLTALKQDAGLQGITGPIYGRLPSASAASTRAQALLDKILAKGQFRSLLNLRLASPTGGALGNVSDYEGKRLAQAFGALSQTQSTKDFQNAIDSVIADITQTKQNLKNAFDLTYDYRNADSGTDANASAPAGNTRRTASGVEYTVE